MAVIITQDHEDCISCGACASICPANWEEKEDGKYGPIDTKLDDVGCNKEAESTCPVEIIHVKVE
jgi:ferredoxin